VIKAELTIENQRPWVDEKFKTHGINFKRLWVLLPSAFLFFVPSKPNLQINASSGQLSIEARRIINLMNLRYGI
jgi:hypothetical protein